MTATPKSDTRASASQPASSAIMTRELKHLFSDDGALALTTILRTQPLLAFDFDGTLAPFVTRPDDARVTDSVAYSLERLSQLRPLAIVSGRSVDDVTRRIRFTARFIVGNHGAEDLGQALSTDTAPLDIVRLRMTAHVEELRAAGVLVEDKRHSLALHYRAAADQRQAAGIIEALLTNLPATLRYFHGKCVFNVVTTDAPDKCQAVISLIERAHCDSAVFVGDDLNDESVFARARPNWLTVRVGRDDPISQAAFFLDRQAEVATLLDTMLGLLQVA